MPAADDISVTLAGEQMLTRALEVQLREALEDSAPNLDLNYLFERLVPSVVTALASLCEKVEQENDKDMQHALLMLKEPATIDRLQLNPIRFIASHLIRNNKNYKKEDPVKDVAGFEKGKTMGIRPEDFKQLTVDFNELDIQKLGTIPIGRLRDSLKARGKSLSYAGVRLFMKQCGVTSAGNNVDFETYVAVVGSLLVAEMNKKIAAREADKATVKAQCQLTDTEILYLERQFKLYDKNDDGQISLHEAITVLSQITTDQDVAVNFFNGVDVNQDGRINFVEFCKVQRSVLAQAALQQEKAKATTIAEDQKEKAEPAVKPKQTKTVIELAVSTKIDVQEDGSVNYSIGVEESEKIVEIEAEAEVQDKKAEPTTAAVEEPVGYEVCLEVNENGSVNTKLVAVVAVAGSDAGGEGGTKGDTSAAVSLEVQSDGSVETNILTESSS